MAEGGLAFLWINEKLDSPHNGDFLDLTELTIKFHPFRANHTNNVEAVDLRNVYTGLNQCVMIYISLMLGSLLWMIWENFGSLLTLHQIILMLIS